MRSSKLLLVLCVLSVSAILAAPALAEITNVTTGTLLFHGDNYEGVAASPSGYMVDPNEAAYDYDPDNGAANPGYWNVVETMYNQVQVTSYGTPGASEGNNYLRVGKPGSLSPQANQYFMLQSTPGDVIHWESMVWAPTAGGNCVQLTSNTWNIITGYWGDGSIAAYDGTDFNVLPITYTAGEWQKWEIDYAIGASTMTMTVDGNVATNVPLMSAGILDRVTYTTDSWACYDEVTVPEPSTLVLLGAGILSLLACAWRKRK